MPFNLKTFKLAAKIVCLKSRLFADIKTDSGSKRFICFVQSLQFINF